MRENYQKNISMRQTRRGDFSRVLHQMNYASKEEKVDDETDGAVVRNRGFTCGS